MKLIPWWVCGKIDQPLISGDKIVEFGIAARLDKVYPSGYTETMMEGVSELRINYGPGYRVYYKTQEEMVIVLLAGGDKSTQAKDIQTALKLARNL
jgi:putative addiction module killer protein